MISHRPKHHSSLIISHSVKLYLLLFVSQYPKHFLAITKKQKNFFVFSIKMHEQSC